MANTNRTPTKGTLTATGVAATTPNSRVLNPLAGALILGLFTWITPSPGALATTGAAGSAVQNTLRTPTVGSLTAAGVQPTGAQGTLRTPPGDVLTGTGQSPGLSTETRLAATVGTLELTGAAPLLGSDVACTPAVTVVALTGVAPDLSLETRLAPGSGGLILGGLTANLLTPQAISPGVGTGILLGAAPALQIPQAMTAGAGVLSLTTSTPVVAGMTTAIRPPAGAAHFGGSELLVPPTATLALTGDLAIGVADRHALPTGGALALAGLAPSADVPHAVTPLVGALATAGSTPGVGSGTQTQITPNQGVLVLGEPAPEAGLTPGTTSLALGGVAPSVVGQGSQSMTPTVGSLVFTGQLGGPTNLRITPVSADLDSGSAAPTLAFTTPRVPNTGALTLSGTVSAVGIAGANAAGTLTLQGAAPTLNIAAGSYTPAVGALVLTGQTPGVDQSNVIIVQTTTGTLVLSGDGPTLDLRLLPGAGSLTPAGVAGFLDWGIVPVVSALTLTGDAPSLLNPTGLTPAAGTLVLQGEIGSAQGVYGGRRRLWAFQPWAMPIGPTHVQVI